MMTALLAAGVGDVLPVLFVLIALASGIINYFREKSAAAQAQQQRRPNRQREQEVDSEIEMFLEEVAGPDDRERRPQRKRPRRRPQDRPRRKRRPDDREESQSKQRESVKERHMEVGELSSVSQRHVESSVSQRQMHSRVENRHLEPNVEANAATGRSRSRKASPIAQMFQTGDGVRTAIILTEILAPPPGRRDQP